jgi:hypothetical protein
MSHSCETIVGAAFQGYADGELPPSKFGVLWNHREEFDFLAGYVNGGALLHESSNRISQSQR